MQRKLSGAQKGSLVLPGADTLGPMSDRVIVSIESGIADVRLNRPDKLNGLDLGMFEGLVEAGKRVRDDKSVRAVVLSGEGRAFCAGLDFMSFFGGSGGMEKLADRHEGSPANVAQRCGWIWQEVPVPVIAAIHGHCYGGGMQIAAATDIRIAHPDSKLSIMEIKWGLIPDMSGTQTFTRLLPLDVLKELVFTGRIVSGTEAVLMGLVTRTSDDPRQDALALAEEIAGKSPHAIRAGKQLFNAAVQLDTEASFALEEKLQRSLLGSPNQMEAVQANMQKRSPKFADPE